MTSISALCSPPRVARPSCPLPLSPQHSTFPSSVRKYDVSLPATATLSALPPSLNPSTPPCLPQQHQRPTPTPTAARASLRRIRHALSLYLQHTRLASANKRTCGDLEHALAAGARDERRHQLLLAVRVPKLPLAVLPARQYVAVQHLPLRLLRAPPQPARRAREPHAPHWLIARRRVDDLDHKVLVPRQH
eukprot:3597163-Rhodomonas_salina.1